jgi:enoyl-CoA hydratase / 3-hydroxyacyl-CoA dehydrogenase
VPVAYHAEKTLEHYGKLYEVSNSLKLQAEKKEDWEIDPVDGSSIIDETRKVINDRLLGVIFFVCSELLDEKICTPVEINRGARIGLAWRKGPIDLMKKLGESESRRLIYDISVKYNEKIPQFIGAQYWNMELVTLSKKGNNAIITINRPEDMNALNESVVNQLEDKFNQVNSDPSINTIFITGSGKAFVAGADIKFFIDNIKSNSIEEIVEFTKYCQDVYNSIDKSKKNVVAVLNGLTLGGGLELALCADVILSFPGAVLAYPETGIGIYPGLGGTQRTQNKIGKELTKYLVFTGDMLNAQDAKKIGLVDKIINIAEMFEIFEGIKPVPISIKEQVLDDRYLSIQNFFSHYVFGESNYEPSNDSNTKLYEKLTGRIKHKAPLAVKTAEKLINDCKGCASELEYLTYIFSTADALLGLSSIGKKVEYIGR